MGSNERFRTSSRWMHALEQQHLSLHHSFCYIFLWFHPEGTAHQFLLAFQFEDRPKLLSKRPLRIPSTAVHPADSAAIASRA
jgi:hypothetical protein